MDHGRQTTTINSMTASTPSVDHGSYNVDWSELDYKDQGRTWSSMMTQQPQQTRNVRFAEPVAEEVDPADVTAIPVFTEASEATRVPPSFAPTVATTSLARTNSERPIRRRPLRGFLQLVQAMARLRVGGGKRRRKREQTARQSEHEDRTRSTLATGDSSFQIVDVAAQ
jgi:hypothetical protein